MGKSFLIKKIIFPALAILCVSCASSPNVGTEIDLDDVNEMAASQATTDEAAHAVKPSILASDWIDDPSVYRWRYPKPGFGGTSDALVVILFDEHGIVTRVYKWRSKTNSSRIDLIDVNQLIHSQTTVEEATELLGLPNRTRVRIDGSSVYWWHGSDSGFDRSTAAAPDLFDDQGDL